MGDALPIVDLGAGKKAIAVAASREHTCALLDDGQIKCWGQNDYGQLGLGDNVQRGDDPGEMGDALPIADLGAGKKAIAITVGTSHTCALLDDGQIKCWGSGLEGALGLGDQALRGDEPNEMGDALPVVDLGTGVRSIAVHAGRDHTCALLDTANVKCWGQNLYGQLGLGNMENRGDFLDQMGGGLPTVKLGANRKVAALSVGGTHACALLDDGHLKCWGNGGGGALGLGDTTNRGDEPAEVGDMLPPVFTW
jgi:alpha-tubulin suppressor-like RCC1 family protein